MHEAPKEQLLPDLEDRPVHVEEDDWFEPVVPQRPAPNPIPKSKPRPLADLVDKMRPEMGLAPQTKIQASDSVEDADAAKPAPSTRISAASVNDQLPPPRVATATEVFTWINKVLLAKTPLSDDGAALVAFWTISTWLQQDLALRPCLVITGPAHDASRVLHVLNDLCCRPALLAGFRRGHLEVLRYFLTHLISEPNLAKHTANLLSNLTDAEYAVVAGSSLARHSKSAAIYAGEDPEPHKIENCIRIHMTPISGKLPAASLERVDAMVERLPVHLNQYSEKNVSLVKQSSWVPSGLSSEMATVATALGRCIVNAPELQDKLVTLLKAHDKLRLAEISDTREAGLLEAILNLIHQGKEKAFVREVADEINRIQKERGERLVYSPETVGHMLKKIGLATRRLGKDGRGLEMNLVTVKRVHELAAMYGGAGLEQKEDNLHCPQCNENTTDM